MQPIQAGSSLEGQVMRIYMLACLVAGLITWSSGYPDLAFWIWTTPPVAWLMIKLLNRLF